MHKTRNIVLFVIISVLLGSAVTGLSLLCPKYFESFHDTTDFWLGWPVPFLHAESDVIFGADYFPRYVAPQYWTESWQSAFSHSMNTGLCIVCVIANTLISAIIIFIIMYLSAKQKAKRKKKDEPVYTPVFR